MKTRGLKLLEDNRLKRSDLPQSISPWQNFDSAGQTCPECSLKIREWMTTEEAAAYLGLTVGALRNMASNGQIPYHKLGRRNRYRVVELRQLLLSQKRGVCHGY